MFSVSASRFGVTADPEYSGGSTASSGPIAWCVALKLRFIGKSRTHESLYFDHISGHKTLARAGIHDG